MSEDVLVKNSSPTLAGLKTGSLFNLAFQSEEEREACLRGWNQVLSGKGLRACPVRIRENRALIYVYRPSQLARDLRDPAAAQILRERGYCPTQPDRCLARLMERLKEGNDASAFPHEIGLFLGYPPEDVSGFIQNATGQKFTGMWKVYGDVQRARRLFASYKKCTEVYCRQFFSGVSLERLAVAG